MLCSQATIERNEMGHTPRSKPSVRLLNGSYQYVKYEFTPDTSQQDQLPQCLVVLHYRDLKHGSVRECC